MIILSETIGRPGAINLWGNTLIKQTLKAVAVAAAVVVMTT